MRKGREEEERRGEEGREEGSRQSRPGLVGSRFPVGSPLACGTPRHWDTPPLESVAFCWNRTKVYEHVSTGWGATPTPRTQEPHGLDQSGLGQSEVASRTHVPLSWCPDVAQAGGSCPPWR